jgi:hypothetical protein
MTAWPLLGSLRLVSADSHKNQRSKILAELVRAKGGEVPLPEILALNIAQYSARIHELRKLGFRITNRTEVRDGKRCSWFKLVPSSKAVQDELALSGLENPRYPD